MNKKQLKVWMRSRSLRFALDMQREPGAGENGIRTLLWNGADLSYRIGSSDIDVIHSILLKRGNKAEYFIPRALKPSVIFDIGGNIGCAALYFASTYPNAKVLSFEPIQANFTLLQKNIEPYPNIQGFCIALGSTNETLDLIESPDDRNRGGYSIYQRGAAADADRISVTCRNIGEFISETKTAPDLIKIDTEGAEYMILKAIPEAVISRVLWIVGELHGENDFELLSYLAQWFEIGIRKSVNGPLCNFHARNRALVP